MEVHLRPRDDASFHENVGIFNRFYSKSLVFEPFLMHRKALVTHLQATILTPASFPLVSGSTTTFFIELSKPIIFSIFSRLFGMIFLQN